MKKNNRTIVRLYIGGISLIAKAGILKIPSNRVIAVCELESHYLLFKYYIMKIETKYGTYEERELAQLIRRKMMSRVYKDKTKYTRKVKHKKYD